jgi:hypothetical protein
MEMEDPEEMDTDDVSVMEDISPSSVEEEALNYPHAGLPAIAGEGLFRAGTPTPVITPPFPQIVVPLSQPNHDTILTVSTGPFGTPFPVGMDVFEGLPLMVSDMSDNMFDGVMEEEPNAIESLVETQENSTEELDTECTYHQLCPS